MWEQVLALPQMLRTDEPPRESKDVIKELQPAFQTRHIYPTITVNINATVLKEVIDIGPARWGNGDTLIHFDV